MLILGSEWPKHRAWCLITAVLAALAGIWYGFASIALGRLPGGSSAPGFTFGVVGGLIIVFEMLLWPRKSLRRLRLGRMTLWMKAHIWLGLLSLPLIFLHGAANLTRGTLAGGLMILFLGVVASGVIGLWLQQILPERMLDRIPAETIHARIDHELELARQEAANLVRITCGIEETEEQLSAVNEAGGFGSADYLIVGAVRTAGRLQGKVAETRTHASAVPGAEALKGVFDSQIDRFLQGGPFDRSSPLAQSGRAEVFFQKLKAELPAPAHDTVDVLIEMCDRRRQLAEQTRIHAWLHGWLWVHLPLSAAMFVLMIIHVVVALEYL